MYSLDEHVNVQLIGGACSSGYAKFLRATGRPTLGGQF